jgi:hypothetical protein
MIAKTAFCFFRLRYSLRPNPVTRGVILTVPLLCFLANAAGDGSSVAGWVIQCNGTWEDRTVLQRPVKIACKGSREELWFPLSRESKLALTSHNAKQWIDVRIARTGEKHRFDCDTPGECDPPPLPFARFVPNTESAGVLQVFLRSPAESWARVRLLLSKGDNDESTQITIDHAVVAEGTAISARDLLRPATPAGEYLVELCPFDEKNGCLAGSKPVSLKWPPDSTQTWPRRLTAGLYEVVLNKVLSGVTMRTPDRGLLLVASRQNIGVVREEVRTGEQEFLRDWKDPSEGKLMFQALLVDLASRQAK